ncbi:MAG: hypothetical protein Q8L27_02320 [archaeon]|nr:hypothetical protein [archaeon]
MANNLLKNKRAQHETIGFVLIILIFVIAVVIFLGFQIRKSNPNIATDAELTNFLIASSEYTSECYLNAIPDYRSLKQLESDCFYRNFEAIKCPNGLNACEMLNITYRNMLSEFRPGGRVLSYYKLNFYLQKKESDERVFFGPTIVSGNLSGCISKRGAKSFIEAGEDNIIAEIEVCERD